MDPPNAAMTEHEKETNLPLTGMQRKGSNIPPVESEKTVDPRQEIQQERSVDSPNKMLYKDNGVDPPQKKGKEKEEEGSKEPTKNIKGILSEKKDDVKQSSGLEGDETQQDGKAVATLPVPEVAKNQTRSDSPDSIILSRLDNLTKIMGTMKSDMENVKSDLKTVKSDMENVKSDLKTVKSDIENVKSDLKTVKSDMENVKGDMKV